MLHDRNRLEPPRRSRPASLLLALTIGVFAAMSARADDPHADSADKPLLPTWCLALPFVIGNSEDPVARKDGYAAAKVAKIKRTGCNGPWHFCWGLVRINRATLSANNTARRRGLLSGAIADFQYVIDQSEQRCTLRPDAYMKQGEVSTMLRSFKKAEKYFMQSIKLKPRQSGSYIGLSDLYEQRGNLGQSIAILRKGIEAFPRSNALKRKLQRLETRISGGGEREE